MAKKKPRVNGSASGKPKPPNRSPHRQLNLRLKPLLFEAFQEYVESIEPSTTATAVVEMLIRNHLGSLGRWPPKQPQGE